MSALLYVGVIGYADFLSFQAWRKIEATVSSMILVLANDIE